MTAHTAPKPPPPGARLIPIDFESPHERDLLHAQRVICGWKTDAIEEWREHVQEKKQVMFWIALPGNLSGIPTYKDVNTMDMPRISRAEQKEGDEDEETQEEKEKEGGNEEDRETGLKEGQEGKREREREYLPVGHINLDHEDFAAAYWGLSESCGLTEPDGSVLTLTLLFVRCAPSPFGFHMHTHQHNHMPSLFSPFPLPTDLPFHQSDTPPSPLGPPHLPRLRPRLLRDPPSLPPRPRPSLRLLQLRRSNP